MRIATAVGVIVPTMFGALLLTTLPAATHELPQRQLPPECIDPETGEIRLSLRDDPLCVLQQGGATGSLGVAPSSAPVDAPVDQGPIAQDPIDQDPIDQDPIAQDPDPTPTDPDPTPTATSGNPGNDEDVGQATEGPGPNSEESFGPTGVLGRGDSQDSSAGGQGHSGG